MTLLEKWRVLARAWSVQLAAIGALLYAALLAIDPASLQAAWQAMPADVRALLPANVTKWVTAALFLAVIATRGAKQPAVAERLGLLGTVAGAPPAWLVAARGPIARTIASIAIHCSATPEGRPVRAAEIRRWHRERGFADIGYHFVVGLDGTIEAGRPLAQPGAHVAGFNNHSIGVCYVGGLAADAKTPKDTRTSAQKDTLVALLTALKARFPAAEIKGHRDYPNVAKACPSFDARADYAELGK